ncbi:hypothetical protein FRC01_009480, partial [Tulasnella sp. 417]
VLSRTVLVDGLNTIPSALPNSSFLPLLNEKVTIVEMFNSVQSPSKATSRLTSPDLGLALFRFVARSTSDPNSPAEVNRANSAHETKVRTGILIGVLCTMFVVVWSVLICRAKRRRAFLKALEKQNRIDQYNPDVERAAGQHQQLDGVAWPQSRVPSVHSSSSAGRGDMAAPQYSERPPMFPPSPFYPQQQLDSYVIVNHSSPNLHPPPPAYTRP